MVPLRVHLSFGASKRASESALQNQPGRLNLPLNCYDWQAAVDSTVGFCRFDRPAFGTLAPSDPVGALAGFEGSAAPVVGAA
jgi:hypothetical protein